MERKIRQDFVMASKKYRNKEILQNLKIKISRFGKFHKFYFAILFKKREMLDF